ncbi:MAG: 1-deoxy-D-xylulose-5-phosphate reductoisomerase [Candidatus Omnitrophota bacterium]|nr:MAG: 1-deoxy-D-xylulose-5-phosphate reductoisomerase [Candidatus Omnitrophota bacterium]
MSKNIVVLGSTGSVGRKVLEVVREFPEEFRIIGLACGSNIRLLRKQIEEFRPYLVAVSDREKGEELLKEVDECGVKTGEDALIELATLEKADIVVFSMAGIKGLIPLIEAIKQRKQIVLANKELLVVGGEIVICWAKEKGVRILPIDSEQSAIFQCLEMRRQREIRRVFLTASGGPLNRVSKKEMPFASPEQVLSHPKWEMGEKISVDSATLMNKGFEIIESKYLFDIPFHKIQVLIHPEVVVHSMVEFSDGAVIAQLGVPDMRLPIQYALAYPHSLPFNRFLDISHLSSLTFTLPDRDRFPALGLVEEAERKGGTALTALNAADEEAIEAFLKGRIRFTDICRVVEQVITAHHPLDARKIEFVFQADKWAREEARRRLNSMAEEAGEQRKV